MKDKLSLAREFLLDGIEDGRFRSGEKLPGARDLAAEVGVSFLVFQHAVSSLEQDGVLECIPRRGAYVRCDWEDRLIRNHLVVLREDSRLFWLPGFREAMEDELPELRIARRFRKGMFELRVTLYLQEHRSEYMDLSPLLPEGINDGLRFHQQPFRGFREADGRLFGIPFIFSPRVVFYNRRMLAECGLPDPAEGWSWETFLDCVRTLRNRYAPEQVLNYSNAPHFWMNFIFRAGGKLINRRADGASDICIDFPETVRGIGCVQELRRALFPSPGPACFDVNAPLFQQGKQALAVADREFYSWVRRSGFREWGAVPLPLIPGGSGLTAQATDLVCVRKECADNALARKFIRFLLGGRMQNFIGGECYGIPILKSASEASIDRDDPRDLLFRREMEAMSAEYNVDSSTVSTVIHGGIARIIASDEPPEPAARKLASAIRTVLEIRNEMLGKQ